MADVRMFYALAEGGTLARATTAPKGPDHPYTCLDCGTRVKLRRGPKRAPHFSHYDVTTCTGEGVIHHAAKLELARALREREHPMMLHIPCSWPGCTEAVVFAFDGPAGPHTEVVTEYALRVGDVTYRLDVATLLHGAFQGGYEVYHHHRVPEDKRRSGLSNWVEVHAEPLLDNPYALYMVRDAPPINPVIEAFVHDLDLAAQVHPLDVYHYRAQGSGKWVHEEWHSGEVYVDTYDRYTCPAHEGVSDRLLGAAYAVHFPKVVEPARPSAFEATLERQRRTADFAAAFYQARQVPGHALLGLHVKACRCPGRECRAPGVFVMSTFAPEWRAFGPLARLSRDRQHLLNFCGACGAYADRKLLGFEDGVSLVGDLVAARLSELVGS
ncbi:competence protein CoiA family protein [Deinococcus multiflagellatus]|uniref:Competence protein CoiA family protein n=1 Tax=Deinococcus multiflagellatus TaxID=1656887 RepID=A0ABW1ZQK2_9DEIO|nr:competence protein CoiA family protein [Deinococcus multiflagellatus]MBZ9715630.1 hypothetical protein [Deinococcus multiflagellatus]